MSPESDYIIPWTEEENDWEKIAFWGWFWLVWTLKVVFFWLKIEVWCLVEVLEVFGWKITLNKRNKGKNRIWKMRSHVVILIHVSLIEAMSGVWMNKTRKLQKVSGLLSCLSFKCFLEYRFLYVFFCNERLEYHGLLWFGNGLEFLVSILHASWLELLDIMVGISGS